MIPTCPQTGLPCVRVAAVSLGYTWNGVPTRAGDTVRICRTCKGVEVIPPPEVSEPYLAGRLGRLAALIIDCSPRYGKPVPPAHANTPVGIRLVRWVDWFRVFPEGPKAWHALDISAFWREHASLAAMEASFRDNAKRVLRIANPMTKEASRLRAELAEVRPAKGVSDAGH